MGRNINKNGLLGTIIFHGIIAAILLLLGFHTPLPLPEEKGILISFGDSPQGKGKPSAEKQTQKAKPNTGKTTPPPKTEKPKSNNPIKPTSAPKILTQNIEEAPAIKSGNAKKKKEEIRKKEKKKT